jgi:hypothetical protein
MADRIGFRLIEPPGWVSLAVDDPDTRPVHALAKRIASASEPDARSQVEHLVYRQLSDALAQARRNGGLDLLLPIELVHGLVLPMTIVVSASPRVDGNRERAQSDALLAYAGRHDGAAASEIGGALAVRSVVDVAAGDAEDDPSRAFATRRITYVIAAPVPTQQLLIVACSIQRFDYDTDGEIIEAMEFLFDAIAGTIRFDPVYSEAGAEASS